MLFGHGRRRVAHAVSAQPRQCRPPAICSGTDQFAWVGIESQSVTSLGMQNGGEAPAVTEVCAKHVATRSSSTGKPPYPCTMRKPAHAIAEAVTMPNANGSNRRKRRYITMRPPAWSCVAGRTRVCLRHARPNVRSAADRDITGHRSHKPSACTCTSTTAPASSVRIGCSDIGFATARGNCAPRAIAPARRRPEVGAIRLDRRADSTQRRHLDAAAIRHHEAPRACPCRQCVDERHQLRCVDSRAVCRIQAHRNSVGSIHRAGEAARNANRTGVAPHRSGTSFHTGGRYRVRTCAMSTSRPGRRISLQRMCRTQRPTCLT